MGSDEAVPARLGGWLPRISLKPIRIGYSNYSRENDKETHGWLRGATSRELAVLYINMNLCQLYFSIVSLDSVF